MEAKKEALREAIARGEQKTAGRRKQSTQSEEKKKKTKKKEGSKAATTRKKKGQQQKRMRSQELQAEAAEHLSTTARCAMRQLYAHGAQNASYVECRPTHATGAMSAQVVHQM